MATAAHDAKQSLDEHAKAIDALHHKLASTPGADKERLHHAVDKYKKAHQTFCDDVQECLH
jgi:hypothetical protein